MIGKAWYKILNHMKKKYWTSQWNLCQFQNFEKYRSTAICFDVPVSLHSIWKLLSSALFACTFDYRTCISSIFLPFLPFFFFCKKLEEIPFFQFLPEVSRPWNAAFPLRCMPVKLSFEKECSIPLCTKLHRLARVAKDNWLKWR